GLVRGRDPRIILRHLLGPRVVGPETFPDRRDGQPADRELRGAIEKVATGDVAVLVLVEQVEELLRILRRLLPLHRAILLPAQAGACGKSAAPDRTRQPGR